MSTKSPISILEELAVLGKIQKPRYSIDAAGLNGFLCSITCGTVTASSFACSKKLAKHQCADQALLILQKQNVIECETSKTVKDQCNFNAVGKLNELCAQYSLLNPNYDNVCWDMECFVIECRCLSYSTNGRATTKKQAKQLAAQHMLNILESSKLEKANDQRINLLSEEMEFAKQLYVKYKAEESATNKTEWMNELTNQLKHKAQITIPANSEEIKAELSNLCKYDITIFQSNPLILVLQVTGSADTKYTFIESRGANYSECSVLLLQSALEAMKILSN